MTPTSSSVVALDMSNIFLRCVVFVVCLSSVHAALLRGERPSSSTRETVFDVLSKGSVKFYFNPHDFDILNYLIAVTGLHEALDDRDRSLTLFAPTDAAFVELAREFGLNGDDESVAYQVLSDLISSAVPDSAHTSTFAILVGYHISPFKMTSTEILSRGTISTVIGDDLTRVQSGSLKLVGKAEHSPTASLMPGHFDLLTANGVIHVVDKVLLPFDLDTESLKLSFLTSTNHTLL